MLRLEHVTACYEPGVPVLKDVSLTVERGSITCILGSNGAGKTTLLRTITNLLRPASGAISHEGARIDRLPTHRIIRRGIAVVPEGRRLFPGFTVDENLRIGAFTETGRSVLDARRDEVFRIFPVLRERRGQLAGTLSGGEQGMLSMARALMARPGLLLLDEPSLGLAPLLVKELFRVIRRINESGVTVLLIEQNARKSMAVASRGYVLQKGVVVAAGARAELAGSEALRRAYL